MTIPATIQPTLTEMRIGIGSYTTDGQGTGLRIFGRRLASSEWTLRQEVPIENAAYIIHRGELVLAVSEASPGGLTALKFASDRCVIADQTDLLEDGPCHVSFADEGRLAIVANYVAGTITAVDIDAKGNLGVPRTLMLPLGSGPNPERQSSPHAHQSLETSWGTVLVTDLGGDRLLEISVEAKKEPVVIRTIHMPLGSGPRHMAWYKNHLVVVGELDSRLHLNMLSQYENHYVGSVSTFATGARDSTNKINEPSHISASDDGRHLFVLNRGRDTVSVFAFEGPALAIKHETPTGGHWPRHFVQIEERLLIANQRSGTVTEFIINAATGTLMPTGQTIQVQAPACIMAL